MLMRRVAVLAVVVACGGSSPPAQSAQSASDRDPEGPRRAQVAANVQPMIDAELVTGIVVGLYDAGKLEIYGFGKGPGGKPPNGATLFELGAVTKPFTSLLLADSVQRREVQLDSPVAELLPVGVTAPTKDKQPITLRHLSVHSSGLPALPASVKVGPDPYGTYTENLLYQDLVRTQLDSPPGERLHYSEFGVGLLGHLLGRKIGGGYESALDTRVLRPLGLKSTFVRVPQKEQARRANGTNEDLVPVPAWNYDALAGAGGLTSSVRDLLAFVAAELDASAGSQGTLRHAMRLTQEAQLARPGDNVGLGWQIDNIGRYWHSGGTGGFHSFVGFDPKTRRGVVVLASTNSTFVDQLATQLYKVLANEAVKPFVFPQASQLSGYAGKYNFQGTTLSVSVVGKRLYLEGPGEPRIRMVPISEKEFWIERLQAIAIFEREGDKVKRAIFVVGNKQLSAPRVD